MTDNSSDIAIPVGTFAFHSPIQSYTINFHNGTEVVGRFDFNGPKMTFEGNADESVDLFVKALSHWFEGRLKQEREAEREACARVCMYMYSLPDLANAWDCAAAIRARGEA